MTAITAAPVCVLRASAELEQSGSSHARDFPLATNLGAAVRGFRAREVAIFFQHDSEVIGADSVTALIGSAVSLGSVGQVASPFKQHTKVAGRERVAELVRVAKRGLGAGDVTVRLEQATQLERTTGVPALTCAVVRLRGAG